MKCSPSPVFTLSEGRARVCDAVSPGSTLSAGRGLPQVKDKGGREVTGKKGHPAGVPAGQPVQQPASRVAQRRHRVASTRTLAQSSPDILGSLPLCWVPFRPEAGDRRGGETKPLLKGPLLKEGLITAQEAGQPSPRSHRAGQEFGGLATLGGWDFTQSTWQRPEALCEGADPVNVSNPKSPNVTIQHPVNARG